MKIITREEFFETILDGKSVFTLKNTHPDELHYLQLIFFNVKFAKIVIVFFLALSFVPLIVIKILWLRILATAILLYVDYRFRYFIKSINKPLCIYEIIKGEENKKKFIEVKVK